MNLIYFTEGAYNQLAQNNVDFYDEAERLSDYFAEAGIKEPYKTSSVVVRDINLECTGDDNESKNRDDLQNAKLLYGAFKLTPGQASDPKMWSALCLYPYRDYVFKRWRKSSVNIERRFIAYYGRKSLCYENALSRLWWSAHLTYDEEEKSNPFHLTEVLFSTQKIQNDLIFHPMSMNKTIVKGMLKALRKIQNEIGENDKCSVIFRECKSYLNQLGAVVILDCLTAEEIENKAYEFMRNKKVLSGV